LVAVETGVIESSICVADAQRQRWIVRCASSATSDFHWGRKFTIRCKIVDKIQIVRPEIGTSEWCSGWHSKACRSTASQGCIEVWCHGQGAGESVVEARNGDGGPDYVYCVIRLFGWVGGLADEVGWSLAGNVYLQGIEFGG
jgi:hypothetical protein